MMNFENNKSYQFFMSSLDVVIIGLVLLAFRLSMFLYQPINTVFSFKEQFISSFVIVLIAFLNLICYRIILPKFTGCHRWKVWQLLTFAGDITFWTILIGWIIYAELAIVDLLKFGMLFLAVITLLLFVGFVLIKTYHQKRSLSQRYGMDKLLLPNHLASHYQRQTVLITGAAGTIGSELAHQLATIQNGIILLLDQSETSLHDLMQTVPSTQAELIPVLCDIRSTIQIQQVFEQYKPSIVFHAAAYKQLPILEHFPSEAVATNIVGTKNLVDAAILHKIHKFIFISTDKAVNPISVLGITKKIAEEYVQLKMDNCITTRWAVVRFGNVWNSNGSVLPSWNQQLNNGTSIEVRNPSASRYFISVSKVSNLLLEIGAFLHLDQKYLLSMGEPILIKRLAEQYIKSRQYEYISHLSLNYSNLLDGEKVHESLVSDIEKLKVSNHPMINTIISSSKETPFLEHDLNVLLNSYQTMDKMVLKKMLFSLIKK